MVIIHFRSFLRLCCCVCGTHHIAKVVSRQLANSVAFSYTSVALVTEMSGCLSQMDSNLESSLDRDDEGLLLVDNGSHEQKNYGTGDDCQHIKKRQPVGLSNLGNTCYFNSSMQCLAQTFLFEKLLSEGRHQASEFDVQQAITTERIVADIGAAAAAKEVMTLKDENFRQVTNDKNKHVFVLFYEQGDNRCDKLIALLTEFGAAHKTRSDIIVAKMVVSEASPVAGVSVIDGPKIQHYVRCEESAKCRQCHPIEHPEDMTLEDFNGLLESNPCKQLTRKASVGIWICIPSLIASFIFLLAALICFLTVPELQTETLHEMVFVLIILTATSMAFSIFGGVIFVRTSLCHYCTPRSSESRTRRFSVRICICIPSLVVSFIFIVAALIYLLTVPETHTETFRGEMLVLFILAAISMSLSICGAVIFVSTLPVGNENDEAAVNYETEARNVPVRTLTGELREFYRILEDRNKRNDTTRSFDPGNLFRKICERSPRFLGNQQQDSHELLRHLMDGVKEDEIKEAGAAHSLPYKGLTVVDRVFGGHFLTIYTCQRCEMPYHLFEPFLDISLPIAFVDTDISTKQTPEARGKSKEVASRGTGESEPSPRHESKGYSKKNTTDRIEVEKRAHEKWAFSAYFEAVEEISKRLAAPPTEVSPNSVLDSLRFFTRREQLDEYMCLECNKDGRQDLLSITRGTKQTMVYNPPAVLTLHLKRFEQTEKHGYVKVSKHIAFDQRLDLAPYCSVYSLRQQKKASPRIEYSLYGVVVHDGGSLQSGHYTACVRVRTVDVSKTRAFFQEKFIDRDELMGKNELIKLVKSSKDDLRYLDVPDIDVSKAQHEWFGISDSSVRRISKCDVFRQEAYLLFYERIV